MSIKKARLHLFTPLAVIEANGPGHSIKRDQIKKEACRKVGIVYFALVLKFADQKIATSILEKECFYYLIGKCFAS